MLRIDRLQVRYGEVSAVKDLSLEVSEGEIVALLGANGAGKSTSLLAVAGALKPAGGPIFFNDMEITGMAPERVVRKGIAMVPETRDVFPDLTVLENMRLGAFIFRGDSSGFKRDLDKMMALFPVLQERAEQAAGTLSGGEQQMLVIARAMMSRPKLLLLDEPSLGLAPTVVDRIFEHILHLKSSGVTMLLVEQNASQALRIADRAYVMQLGEVAASGSARDIALATDLQAIYLGHETTVDGHADA